MIKSPVPRIYAGLAIGENDMSKPTDRELEAMGRVERELALELAQAEEEVKSSQSHLDPQETSPGDQQPAKVEPAPSEPPVEQESTQSAAPEPEPEPALVPEPAPLHEEVIRDVDYWKREAETWKKRKGDSDRALSPAQQEAARLRKEKEERDAIFLRRLDEIESLVKQGAKVVPPEEQEEVPLIDFEFRELYPDIAARMETLQKANETRVARAEAKTKEFEAFFEKQRQEAEITKQDEYRAKHYTEVTRLVPDIADFVDPNKLGSALVAWGQMQPSYKLDVILSPLAYLPADVADVINQFKASVAMNAPRPVKKPNLGDLATKASGSPQIATEVVSENLLTDAEYNSIDELMRSAARDPRKVSELLVRYERTTEHKMQHA